MNPKQILWGDYDNDGDPDLFISVYESPSVLMRNDGDLQFTDVSVDAGIPQIIGHKSFGASWGDYDQDGFIDLYITNYNVSTDDVLVENVLLHNEGDGSFTNQTSSAGVGNGLRQSFGAIWFDYDKNGSLDLYVINDKAIFCNTLYRNAGDGTFDDVSSQTNTDIAISAMSATAGDFDNDGWIDLYITNGPTSR